MKNIKKIDYKIIATIIISIPILLIGQYYLFKIGINLEYFEAYAKGFLSETKGILNQTELDNLVFGAKLMTLECGIRFLDDYLDGDHYFKIHRDGHNLDRCKTQFKLVIEIEKYYDTLNDIVKKLYETCS